MRRWDAGTAVALLAVTLTLLVISCRSDGGRRDDAPPVEPRAPATDGAAAAAPGAPTFVGHETCTECHAAEAARWAGSHHDLAMQEADGATVLGDFDDATFTYAGTTSRFLRRDDRFVVVTDGPDGTLQEYEIAYAFGVTPLQQYLVPLPGGRLQALAFAWDSRPVTEGGQRWLHLYPDDAVTHGDALHWTQPSQNWNDRCAACHSTDLRKRYRAATRDYDTTWAELDVACEACHGPGSAHVAAARATPAHAGQDPARGATAPGNDGPDAGTGLVVRFPPRPTWQLDASRPTALPAHPLASRAELTACAPCHARRSELGPDPVPGAPLLDTYEPALLDEGLYEADGQIRDEVYEWGSFLQSRMYAAGVTCSDCHDPHALTLRAGGNALCAGCHRADVFDVAAHHFHPAASPGARCVACHMPARTYMQVDERRDHSFRVPRPDLSLRLGVPNTCAACHPDRTPTWAAEIIAERTGGTRLHTPHYADALAAARGAAASAVPMLVGLADDAAQPAIARATALSSLHGTRDPRALAAVERGAAATDPLLRLGAMRALEGGDPATTAPLAAARLDDTSLAVRLTAARILAGAPASALRPVEQHALSRTIAEYERALRIHADRPEALSALGQLQVRLGRIDEAEASLRTAIAVAPYFVPTYVNLADLRRAQQRDVEGEELLRTALAQAPESAEVHHALGLLLVRRGQLPAAVGELTRAVELAPDTPRFAYVLGVALHSTGDGARALETLRAARRRAPGDPDLLLALATISRDRGDLAAARTYADAWAILSPWDERARALRDSLAPVR